ncbi:MAG: hypothetical protein JNM07_08710 [Phycisphaerae bacterium]|nr:hypothetical protein [Phycisphaerae bacterium]
MGIDHQTLRLLLAARRRGARLDRCITLGRQDILVPAPALVAAFAEYGLPLTLDRARALLSECDRFADPLLRELGAVVTDSMDRSAFEGATVLHDLNEPLPETLRARYSFVFDGGTLEHVFHFPQALRNCMDLTAVGGHVVLISPANNFMGHGFYQISPELFWRALSPENGFEIDSVILAPAFAEGTWLRVRDPAQAGERIGHNGGIRPLYLFAIARRTAIKPIFATPPQQSDYAAEWSGKPDKLRDPGRLSFLDEAAARRPSAASRLKSAVRALIPDALRRVTRAYKDGRGASRPPDPRFFERFDSPR